jgi:hypothetical protein
MINGRRGAATRGLDRWSVTGMALLLFIALLALLCLSIRAELTRREHGLESGGISPSGPGFTRSRYGEMLPS